MSNSSLLVCQSLSSFLHISVSSEGVEVLGIPTGSEKFAADATYKWQRKICDKLIGFPALQSSMLLLRHCHVGSLDHLAQSI